MSMALTRENLFQVNRFRIQYLVPLNQPSPESVKARLDEAVTKDLAGFLSNVAERLFPPSDSAVLLIRQLEINVDVNAAWEQDQMARRWAKQIIRSLNDVQQGEADSENMLRFANRAAYLASFLADLAAGCAWGKWYYEPFEGLHMLSTSAALRTAICDQPATGLAGLHELTAYDLTKVLQALTAQDIRRILDSIADARQNGDEGQSFQALRTVWETTELGPLQASDEWQNALRLYLKVTRQRQDLSGFALKATAFALLRLACHLASNSASQANILLAALTSGSVSNLYSTVGTSDAETLLPLLRCSPEQVKEMGQALLARYSGHLKSEPATENDSRSTPFGSLFLLLPFLEALPLEDITENWPNAGDVPAATLIRFLLFVKCCGRANAQRVFFDSLVRDLMGIDLSLSPLAIKRWQSRLSRQNLETFLAEMFTWQYEYGAASGQTLVLARATLPGGAVAILLDCLRGTWLTALSYQRSKLESLAERLSAWLSQDDQDKIVLLSDELFVEMLRSAFPHLLIEGYRSASAARLVEEDTSIKELLARMDRLTSELSYLSMPTTFRMSRSLDLALSVAAQGILRNFAWSLPGFSRSGLPYLYSNFLDVPGSIEDEPTRRVVRLGRPPLNIVLGMTGMASKTYQVSWLDERPFVLFQEE